MYVCNVDNAVCLPNMVEGTLRGDDKKDTILGVSSNDQLCMYVVNVLKCVL